MPSSYPTLIPVKTRALLPPHDDLCAALKEALPPLKNGDVLCLTSKVVSIDEGRCMPCEGRTLQDLKRTVVPQETPWWLPPEMNRYGFMLTIVHHVLLSNAGIDESNSNGYFTFLPENPTASAKRLNNWLKETYGLKKMAVIIADSQCTPLRYGASGVAIGAHGIRPVRDYRGSTDIFNRELRFAQSNMLDPLAAAAVNLMGEGAEQTPAVIIRDWPGLEFSEKNIWDDFVIEPEDDLFWPLLQAFREPKK